MKLEDNISKLFEGITDGPKNDELPSIMTQNGGESPASPKEKILQTQSGIDRRQFSRAEVLDQRLELKFSSAVQFARQYIENISMGGLFVRTEQKAQLGDLIPIEFAIPSKESESGVAYFQLTAKVCRVAPQGLGLEFTNLSLEHRTALEKFVQSVLPKGIPLQMQKPKASSVDQLERLRLERSIRNEKNSRFIKKALTITILIALNIILFRENMQQDLNLKSVLTESIRIGAKEIPTQQITDIEKNKNNQWVIRLADGTEVQTRLEELSEAQLPAHLQHTVRILQSIPPKETPRRSKNTRGLTSTRH